jgi:hypothetical protein
MNRVFDTYLTRIRFLNMDAPKKNSESFKSCTVNSIQTMDIRRNEVANHILHRRSLLETTAAWSGSVCMLGRRTMEGEKREWCAAASSFDAELAACEIAIT